MAGSPGCALGGDAVGVVRQLQLPQRSSRAADARVVGRRRARRDGKIGKRIEQRLRFRAAAQHLIQQPKLERGVAVGGPRGDRLQQAFGFGISAAIDVHARAPPPRGRSPLARRPRGRRGRRTPCRWREPPPEAGTCTPRETLGNFMYGTIIAASRDCFRPRDCLCCRHHRHPARPVGPVGYPSSRQTPSTGATGFRNASDRSCSDVVIHADEIILELGVQRAIARVGARRQAVFLGPPHPAHLVFVAPLAAGQVYCAGSCCGRSVKKSRSSMKPSYRIVFYISGHGFGHASRSVEVIRRCSSAARTWPSRSTSLHSTSRPRRTSVSSRTSSTDRTSQSTTSRSRPTPAWCSSTA